jgi:DNA modification methylase
MSNSTLPVDSILQGDCLEILASLPDNSIDLIFADPPYNLQLNGDLWRPNHTMVDGVNDGWDRFESLQDYDRFTRAWLAGCRRVLKETGTIWVIGTYHNIYRVGAILQDLEYWILNDVVWVKSNPMPNFKGVRFTNAQETLIWAQKKRGERYTFNHHSMKALNGDLQMRSDWHLPLCTGRERIKVNGSKAHSAQKPESLLYRVITASSNPGDIILDPFFGTGTTGAVAKKLDRHWIGIEMEAEYNALAQSRIDSITGAVPDDQVYRTEVQRRKARVPFGALLESGLLTPGQYLYFDGRQDDRAVILASGHLRYKDFSGSIHQVAKEIRGAPCNGWECWTYLDPVSGKSEVIDRLRQRLRERYINKT